MTVTGATVRTKAPSLEASGVYSGKPVRGGDVQWARYAYVTNHLIGRGGTLIPHTICNMVISQNGPADVLRFYIWPRYAARKRLWVSTYKIGSAVRDLTIRFTDPSAGTSDFTFSSETTTDRFVHYHFETVGSLTGSEVEVAPSWLEVNDVAEPTLESVALYETPRPDLTLDANDLGVDVASCRSGRPIYTTTGKGPGAVATAVQGADTIAQRAGLFQHARSTVDSIGTTSAAYARVFLADPVLLGRKRYTTSTTAALTVYCRASSGAATTGNIRFTMTSGAVLTLAVTAAMSPTWLTGSLNVDCEDLSVSDGRRSARDDKCVIEWQRTAGASTVNIESISIGNG